MMLMANIADLDVGRPTQGHPGSSPIVDRQRSTFTIEGETVSALAELWAQIQQED